MSRLPRCEAPSAPLPSGARHGCGEVVPPPSGAPRLAALLTWVAIAVVAPAAVKAQLAEVAVVEVGEAPLFGPAFGRDLGRLVGRDVSHRRERDLDLERVLRAPEGDAFVRIWLDLRDASAVHLYIADDVHARALHREVSRRREDANLREQVLQICRGAVESVAEGIAVGRTREEARATFPASPESLLEPEARPAPESEPAPRPERPPAATEPTPSAEPELPARGFYYTAATLGWVDGRRGSYGGRAGAHLLLGSRRRAGILLEGHVANRARVERGDTAFDLRPAGLWAGALGEVPLSRTTIYCAIALGPRWTWVQPRRVPANAQPRPSRVELRAAFALRLGVRWKAGPLALFLELGAEAEAPSVRYVVESAEGPLALARPWPIHPTLALGIGLPR